MTDVRNRPLIAIVVDDELFRRSIERLVKSMVEHDRPQHRNPRNREQLTLALHQSPRRVSGFGPPPNAVEQVRPAL